MPAAARLTDPIGHSPTMSWLLKGLLIGAAIAVTGVLIAGTGGLAAVAIVGGAAAMGAGLGEAMSTMSFAPKEVTGAIATMGSTDVFINGLAAARAHVDMVLCSKHPGPPIPIATGSGQVYINGLPAARVDDKTGCSGSITKGSGNVYIGGGTQQTDTINPENLVPGWVHASLLIVGVGSAIVLAGPVVAVGGLVGAFAGGYGGGWLGGKVFGEGSDGQKWSAIAGSFLGGFLGAKGAPRVANLGRTGPTGSKTGLQYEEIVAPSTGKPIRVAVDGKAIVPVDKVSVYARGGVADVSQELRALQHFKQTARKTFDADPANAARLKQLKSMQHNYERSAAMARELENVGLTDTPANNEVIIKNLLETGQAVNAENRVWVPGMLEGPKGTLQVKSTWKIVDGERVYLTTLMFVPVK